MLYMHASHTAHHTMPHRITAHNATALATSSSVDCYRTAGDAQVVILPMFVKDAEKQAGERGERRYLRSPYKNSQLVDDVPQVSRFRRAEVKMAAQRKILAKQRGHARRCERGSRVRPTWPVGNATLAYISSLQ